MGDALALALILVGLALFVVGDVLWLARHTMSRRMDLRVTGGLVAAGVGLMVIGLAAFAWG